MRLIRRVDFAHLLVAFAGVAGLTVTYVAWLHVTNATTVAVSYLLVVLFVAASSQLWVAIVTSITAMLALNFFFFPPIGTFTVADPENWMALIAFLVVSLVASRLSALARHRQREALNRRDELARLFDLSRDILLTTEPGSEAIAVLARHLSSRFHFDYVSICLPAGTDFERYEAGVLDLRHLLTVDELRRTLSDAERAIEGDAAERMSAGKLVVWSDAAHPVRLVPLRLGTRAIGILATAGRPIEPGTLDTLGSVVAIAIERIHFLEERRQAELAQRNAEFKSALLASLAHDLRTPLTAIRVAANNLHTSWLTDLQRDEQAGIVLTEVERLTRLFQNILEMTRIEAGAVAHKSRWVHPSEIVEAARSQVEPTSSGHHIEVRGRSDDLIVHVDPRLTSAALAHLLENAAQYSPPGSAIAVAHEVTDEGLLVTVEDEGHGIAASDKARLFEPFYRGEQGPRHSTGTGMGLAITRGLLAAEQGRVWAENRQEGGARFSILVPAESRPAPAAADEA
jgi:two-component system, OmpR family, sensor histidine kinase KdpD